MWRSGLVHRSVPNSVCFSKGWHRERHISLWLPQSSGTSVQEGHPREGGLEGKYVPNTGHHLGLYIEFPRHPIEGYRQASASGETPATQSVRKCRHRGLHHSQQANHPLALSRRGVVSSLTLCHPPISRLHTKFLATPSACITHRRRDKNRWTQPLR